MSELYVIAHNMRSTFNVGSLLRTAEGLGIKKVFFTGYTPYPQQAGDTRLPHISSKLDLQIHKTALGAEELVSWEYREDFFGLIGELQSKKIIIAALEQTNDSVPIHTFEAPDKLALLLGEEVEGIPAELLDAVPLRLEIPMSGKKESFNVVIAASMALYHLKTWN